MIVRIHTPLGVIESPNCKEKTTAEALALQTYELMDTRGVGCMTITTKDESKVVIPKELMQRSYIEFID